MCFLFATSHHQYRVVTTNLWQLPTIGFLTPAQLTPASVVVTTNIAIYFTWSHAINSDQTCMPVGCTDALTTSLSGANLKGNHQANKLAKNGVICSYHSERPTFLLVVTALVVTVDPQWREYDLWRSMKDTTYSQVLTLSIIDRVLPLEVHIPITFSSKNYSSDCIAIAKSFLYLAESTMALIFRAGCSYASYTL